MKDSAMTLFKMGNPPFHCMYYCSHLQCIDMISFIPSVSEHLIPEPPPCRRTLAREALGIEQHATCNTDVGTCVIHPSQKASVNGRNWEVLFSWNHISQTPLQGDFYTNVTTKPWCHSHTVKERVIVAYLYPILAEHGCHVGKGKTAEAITN